MALRARGLTRSSASAGRIGFGTATPVLDLHVVSGNTPALRLEQDGSSGFTAQTWDVAGNEAVFFIRDVTSGSRLPFKIQPGAPTTCSRSARSKTLFKEHLVTFDARGLPVTMRSESPDGKVVEMEVAFEAAGSLFRPQTVRSKSATGETTMSGFYNRLSESGRFQYGRGYRRE